MSECDIRSSGQSSTVPALSDPMDIDVGPKAAAEKPTVQSTQLEQLEQPMKPKDTSKAGTSATEVPPPGKKRGRPARANTGNAKPKKDGPSEGKKAKAQAKPKTPRKPPAKRAKKDDLNVDDEPPASSTTTGILPSPPGSPKQASKRQAASRHTGRQHAGSYTREEVRALQTWVNNKIMEDWAIIAQEVGKTTGIYRNKENLRSFYNTVVLRQMYDSFPDKNGQGGNIIAVDVGVCDNDQSRGGVKVCGDCGARLIEGMVDEDVKEKVTTDPTEMSMQTGELVKTEHAEPTSGGDQELPKL